MGNSKSALPYDVGDRVCSVGGDAAGWVMHEGKRKSNGDPVSVFRFDKKQNTGAVQQQLAENFVKRLKTLRHPHVLAYLDGIDTDAETCVVTEAVVPLEMWLKQLDEDGEPKSKISASMSWGFSNVLEAVGFLNEDCKLCHGAISLESILVTKGGDWKLGGLFVVGEMDIGGPSQMFRMTPDIVAAKYKSPERAQHQYQSMTPTATDVFALGIVLYEAFNGPANSGPQACNSSALEKKLQGMHGLMVSDNPSKRPGAKKLKTHPGFKWMIRNRLYGALEFMSEWQLKTDAEKVPFLNDLNSCLDEMPNRVCSYKILPALRDAISPGAIGMGGVSAAAPPGGKATAPHPLTGVVLGPFLKITGMVKDKDDFQRLVVPTVVRLFQSPDRMTRVNLLRHLSVFVQHLDSKTLNGQIFDSICTGFNDNAPQMREQTVKSMVILAPSLNEKNLNEKLLRSMVVLLKDAEPAIRTNTLICLSKIITHFNEETKKKVAMSSFPQGARDQFVPARQAALRGLSSSLVYIQDDHQALAGKVIPGLAYALIDNAPTVRSLAFDVMQKTVDTLREVSEKRANKQEEEERQAKAKAMEQAKAGELGAKHSQGIGGGPGGPPAPPGQDSQAGYLTAAAGWAGNMWRSSSSSSSGSKDGNVGGTGNMSSGPPQNNARPTYGAKPANAKMTLTPSKEKNLFAGAESNGDWGNNDDDLFGDSNGGDGGWGNDGDDLDDEDLLSGGPTMTKKKSSGHVAAAKSPDFFSDMAPKTTKLELKLPNSKPKSSASIADRKAQAAKKREEARARLAQKRQAKKATPVKKQSTEQDDDWDSW